MAPVSASIKEGAAARSTALDRATWRSWLGIAGHVLAVAAALALWAVSLPRVDLARVTDLGLISALPLTVFGAIALLTLSFCLVLRRNSAVTPLALLHVLALIFMLYGITMLVEHGVPRFAPTYKHVGISDYIMQTGLIDTRIDAYFNWPGFFIYAAFISKIAGLGSVDDIVLWAPVVFNVLYLGPLAAIFRSATGDQRFVWAGVWLFFVTNWVGQDYFSPQGLDYFLYLVVFAIVLTWFKSPVRWGRRWRLAQHPITAGLRRKFGGLIAPLDAPNTFSRPGQRIALIGILVGMMAVIVSSHQLTPFAIIIALGGMAVLNRSSLRFMPILLGVLMGTWISFMTENFLKGHVGMVTGHVGQVSNTVSQNVTGRLAGSPQHVAVVYTGLVITLVLWSIAGYGALRSIRKGYWDLTYAVLALAPFALVLLQAYEGELVLRIYLYSLPGMIFFASAAFFTTPRIGRSWMTTIALFLITMGFATAFFVSRYGNERMDYFTAGEINAVKVMYHDAPKNSLLLAGSDNIAWRFEDYASYTTVSLTDPGMLDRHTFDRGRSIYDVMNQVQNLLADRKYPDAYFIITRSEKAYAELFRVFPRGTLANLERVMSTSPHFRVVYRNRDATVFHLASGLGGVP